MEWEIGWKGGGIKEKCEITGKKTGAARWECAFCDARELLPTQQPKPATRTQGITILITQQTIKNTGSEAVVDE